MGNPRRYRDRRAARRAPNREPKKRILVICEGKYTEREYLHGFSNWCRNPRVVLHFAREAGIDPMTLVRCAKEYKRAADQDADRRTDENLRYDEVWCVFDVDDHRRITEAKRMARDNKLCLAVSNPCFELWLLLHFRENPGMQHRDEILRQVRHHIRDYDKHVNITEFVAGYDNAVVKASRLDQAAAADNNEGRNPTTGVYLLTESIRQ